MRIPNQTPLAPLDTTRWPGGGGGGGLGPVYNASPALLHARSSASGDHVHKKRAPQVGRQGGGGQPQWTGLSAKIGRAAGPRSSSHSTQTVPLLDCTTNVPEGSL